MLFQKVALRCRIQAKVSDVVGLRAVVCFENMSLGAGWCHMQVGDHDDGDDGKHGDGLEMSDDDAENLLVDERVLN